MAPVIENMPMMVGQLIGKVEAVEGWCRSIESDMKEINEDAKHVRQTLHDIKDLMNAFNASTMTQLKRIEALEANCETLKNKHREYEDFAKEFANIKNRAMGFVLAIGLLGGAGVTQIVEWFHKVIK